MAAPYHHGLPLAAPLHRLDNLATLPWPASAAQHRDCTITVPLDGSAAAEHALPWALAIARRAGLTVNLVHALPSSLPQWNATSLVSDCWRAAGSRRAQAKRSYLARVSERIYDQLGIEVGGQVVEGIDLGSVLQHEVQEGDLVVMARRPKWWWQRAITSHVVNTAAQRLSCPMLIIPGDDSPVDLASDPVPADVIVGLDGYAVAERILGSATALARLCQARLTLLHVRSDYPSFAIDNPSYYLRDLAQSLGSDLTIRTCVVSAEGRPVTDIIREIVNESDNSLLALSGSPSDRFLRLVQPSVLDNMIAGLQQPLLLQSCEPQ